MNVTRHDTYFAPPGTDDAGTVWTNQTRGFVSEVFLHFHHVKRRYAFSDAHNHADTSVRRFHDRVGRKSRWHVDHRSVGARFFNGVGHGVDYGNIIVGGTTFSRSHTTNNVRSILNHLLSMKSALLAGDSLDDKARILIDKNAQAGLPKKD